MQPCELFALNDALLLTGFSAIVCLNQITKQVIVTDAG